MGLGRDGDGDGILSHICGAGGNINDSTNRTLESRNLRMRQ